MVSNVELGVARDDGRTHLLTVGMEDYFQVGAFHRLIERGQWYRFESRFERNAQRVFELLDNHRIKATFFVSGWTADHYPEIVRGAVDRGHEVASKGYYHRGIRELSTAEFRDDLARSRESVERASGRKVHGFRVSHGGFSAQDLWALDVLVEEGYAYDSSIFPKLGRFKSEPWRRFSHTHEFEGRSLQEFPISSWRIFGSRSADRRRELLPSTPPLARSTGRGGMGPNCPASLCDVFPPVGDRSRPATI